MVMVVKMVTWPIYDLATTTASLAITCCLLTLGGVRGGVAAGEELTAATHNHSTSRSQEQHHFGQDRYDSGIHSSLETTARNSSNGDSDINSNGHWLGTIINSSIGSSNGQLPDPHSISKDQNSNISTNSSTSRPQILTPPFTQLSTRSGQTTVFTCVVNHLGDRQVSWIRGRDLHVLSSGQVTFSSDSRLSVSRRQDSWRLTIRYTQPRDTGRYGCQVNTQPPLAVWYNLTVMEARARIQGEEQLYVQAGSTLALSCVVREQMAIPGLVLWYHNDRLVDRESGRIRVVTAVSNTTTSTLTLGHASTRDSGNYSCWPSAGTPHTVLVHVIRGDPPAAMHHGSGAPLAAPLLLMAPAAALNCLLLYLLT